jgi:hypothetical protein
MYYRRLDGEPAPWTSDPILAANRFTNTYRAADRVSQYLMREVQYHPERLQSPTELFFRTLLFKIFNKIETWELLEREHGPPTWGTIDLTKVDRTLTQAMARGLRIYSGAYIMPAPRYGAERKHANHLRLIAAMMADRLPERLNQAPDLAAVYEMMLAYPGLGHFLAFQYAIDLNYSDMLNFDEGELVVAGPGALDGISKCFASTDGLAPAELIHWVTDRQEEEFAKHGLDFPGLFRRRLQPIDCQNLFCEISKYSRVAHPEISGTANRRRIKQVYRHDPRPLPPPFFPPRWGLQIPASRARPAAVGCEKQSALL